MTQCAIGSGLIVANWTVDQLAETMRERVFLTMDAMDECDGEAAGRIAHKVQQAFRAAMKAEGLE